MKFSAMVIGVDIRVLGTGRSSGVEEYTRQLLAHMIPLDPDVRFKLFYAGRTPLAEQSWMHARNVSVHTAGLSNRLLFARTRLTGRPYLDELVGGADVFFFPHFLLGATSRNCKRVLTFHDLSFERFPEFFSFSRRLWHHFQMRPRRQAMSADTIIAVSESTRRDVIDVYGIAPESVVLVHSGIDPDLKRPVTSEIEAFRAREGLPQRFILALGTIEPRKNLEGLIAAFDMIASRPSCSDVYLVIAGSCGWLCASVHARIANSPWKSRIRRIGSVADKDRAALLSAASVLAYPSFLEGFGFPPLEAMACETPVVASANSALVETVGDAGILVDPYGARDISHALVQVLEDSELRSRLVARGVLRSGVFSWKTASEKMLQHLMATI